MTREVRSLAGSVSLQGVVGGVGVVWGRLLGVGEMFSDSSMAKKWDVAV